MKKVLKKIFLLSMSLFCLVQANQDEFVGIWNKTPWPLKISFVAQACQNLGSYSLKPGQKITDVNILDEFMFCSNIEFVGILSIDIEIQKKYWKNIFKPLKQGLGEFVVNEDGRVNFRPYYADLNKQLNDYAKLSDNDTIRFTHITPEYKGDEGAGSWLEISTETRKTNDILTLDLSYVKDGKKVKSINFFNPELAYLFSSRRKEQERGHRYIVKNNTSWPVTVELFQEACSIADSKKISLLPGNELPFYFGECGHKRNTSYFNIRGFTRYYELSAQTKDMPNYALKKDGTLIINEVKEKKGAKALEVILDEE